MIKPIEPSPNQLKAYWGVLLIEAAAGLGLMGFSAYSMTYLNMDQKFGWGLILGPLYLMIKSARETLGHQEARKVLSGQNNVLTDIERKVTRRNKNGKTTKKDNEISKDK